MATNTSGGTTASLSNTPQAKDDFYCRDEDYLGISFFDVMLNDLGGKAKVLWSIDDGTGTPTDLIGQDLGRAENTLGDKSANGAHIWITSDGKIGYNAGSLNQDFKDDLQALAEGETLTDTFTYAIRMANGTLSWATVTIEYRGANDAPVAYADVNGDDLIVESGVNPGDTPYAGDSSATGNVLDNDVDVDNGAVLTVKDVNGLASNVGSVVTGAYGSVQINSDGSWTYNLDNGDADTQALAQGQTKTEVFTYTMQDEHGATSSSTLTLTITGTNDGPVAVADTGGAGENETKSFDVLLNDTDVDDGAVLSLVSATAPVGKGAASVVAGKVQFDPGTDFDHLAAGATEQVVINYTMQDEHGATSSSTLTLTITGTNDGPVLGAVTNAAIDDTSANDDFANVTGTLTSSDRDTGDGATYGVDGGVASAETGFDVEKATAYGTLYLNSATGAYKFVPNDAAINALDSDDAPVALNFLVSVSDGDASDSATLTITVTGANDTAVIGGTLSAEITEDESPNSVGGTATSADIDDTSNTFVADAGTTNYGSFTINAAGNWVFTLDNTNAAVQSLTSASPFLTDSFTIESEDGTTETVTIHIFGADEGPTFTAPVTYTGLDAVNDHDGDFGVGTSSSPLISGTNNGETINGRTGQGQTADTINALAGDDTVFAGDGGDTVYGGANSDHLYGGAGNDRIFGQGGNDFLYGEGNNDELYGGSGDDRLEGGDNTDMLLHGGSGNDTILGGANGDNIVGGYGADILTGGAGDDVFRYLSKLDTNDTITDFRAAGMGNDQLDLNGIDANDLLANNQDFVWGGDDGPIANGLWFSYDAVTGDTTLYGDTNGNLANAEFMVVLENFSGFSTYGTPGSPPPIGLLDG